MSSFNVIVYNFNEGKFEPYDIIPYLKKSYYNDIQYFGEDISKIDANDEIKELVKNSINKECVTNSGDKGIIIGFEDCSSFSDYYFIVYCPKTEDIVYELINNNNFIKTIQ